MKLEDDICVKQVGAEFGVGSCTIHNLESGM